jgi:GST-like protein
MIDLYTAPTANCQRVSVMLEEAGLAYRVHAIDRAAGETRSPALVALNPAAAVPVVVDSDGPGGRPLVLAQSGAILVYLAEKTGRFLPADPAARALAWQWFLQALTDVNAAASAFFLLSNVVPEKTPSTTEFFRARLVTFMEDCDRQLAGRDYLAGELTIADLALYPVIEFRRNLMAGNPRLANLARWAGAMGARPAVRRGLRVPVPTAPAP